MKADFLHVDDARWNQVLCRLQHDVYHLPDYLRHAAGFEGGRPVAFFAHDDDGELLIPLLIRSLPANLGAPAEWCDAITPYGYSSPVAHTRPDSACDAPEYLARGLMAFRTLARECGIVSAFFRWHPMFPVPVHVPIDGHQLTMHGHTVYIDLSLPEQQLHREVRAGYRQDIRKLSKSGFKVVMDDWRHFSRFTELYAGTMRRVSASDFYFFSDSYFDELRTLLGRWLHLAAVISPTGELASAALFTETNRIVQYHLSATDERFLPEAPSKILMDVVRRWAKRRGNRCLHLGGGVGCREDSLMHFKLGFSKRRAEFYTSRLVPDADRYAQLVEREPPFHSSTGSEVDFFPAYRSSC